MDAEARAEQMAAQARKAAERLSWTLQYAAEQLDLSASLADVDAERHERAGRSDSAVKEREASSRARDAAQRARLRADHWLHYRPESSVLREAGRGDRSAAERLARGEGAAAAGEDEPAAPRPEVSSGTLTYRWGARERAADRRDRVADEREAIANERERLADEREQAANERERLARELTEPREGENGGRRERAEQEEARQQAATERDQAAISREIAATERQTAEFVTERAPEDST